MKNILVVCLVATAMFSVSDGQVKTKGISVRLPSATNATTVPAADRPDALVVAITQDGSVYLGVEQIPLAELPEKAQEAVSKRSDKTVYIKADGRSSSSELVAILDTFAGAHARTIVLLADTREIAHPGTVMLPRGLNLKFADRR